MVTYNTLLLVETEGMCCDVTPVIKQGANLKDAVAFAYSASLDSNGELSGVDKGESSYDVSNQSKLDLPISILTVTPGILL